jgi:hypothetical protein
MLPMQESYSSMKHLNHAEGLVDPKVLAYALDPQKNILLAYEFRHYKFDFEIKYWGIFFGNGFFVKFSKEEFQKYKKNVQQCTKSHIFCVFPDMIPCYGELPLVDQKTGLEHNCDLKCPKNSYCHKTPHFAKCCPKGKLIYNLFI